MLNAVIRFALHHRMLVIAISLTLMVYGSFLTTQMPIDVFPDLDRPRVIVITECPGLATEEVETLVTQPIEIGLLGANGVQDVRSQSTAGLNVIYIEFDWDTDIRAARQTVQERLATLGNVLPPGIRPQMTPPASIMGQVVVAGIYRQEGPRGGEIYPLGKTGWMAEVIGEGTQEASLNVWQPTDRHRVEKWEPIKVDRVVWSRIRENEPLRAEVTIAGQV
ncbi:MAG: efflux RND transporter permease subunit, partial [Planctomycetota bacterium]|nr:efflux RND transporter permease subunit [Planctomycetota bacterium]